MVSPAKEYPIKDYAIIGNCETAALVNPDGGIDWLCLPAFDSPFFFGGLLDREKGGNFGIRPACEYRVEREYINDSAILRTRFLTQKGTLELTDFFVIARQPKARFYDFTSLYPTRKLVRFLKLLDGDEVPIEFNLKASADYGRERITWTRICSDPVGYRSPVAKFYSSFDIEENQGTLNGELSARRDQTYFAVLDYSGENYRLDLQTVNNWLGITESFWREWNLFNYYRGPHEKTIRRSAVTLKLLTYAATGAFVAAPTTSLPERIGGEQNWDYRYTWVRDTALFINTLFRLGYSGEAKAFIRFMLRQCQEEREQQDTTTSTTKSTTLKVLYAIRPGVTTDEISLDQLRGYLRSTPVRVGNRAARQFQLDNYGHLLEAFYYFRHTGGKIDSTIETLLERLANEVVLCWQEPDNGIWETLESKHFTYGKIMAWLALERAASLCRKQRERLRGVAENIKNEVLSRGLAKSNGNEFLAESYESDGVDASALLAFTNGFLPKTVAVATRQEIEKDLAIGAFVYRNTEQRFKYREGAFLLCSFWWISHLIQEGELGRAEIILSKLLDHLGPLGLFAEEIDPGSGEFLGNFPQAFSHLGLIGTILNLEGAKRDPQYHSLADAEKFEKSVGPTIGIMGVLCGFLRVPKTFQLLFSKRSKWI
jgi:GH15 family glucan-1,4-alpha-glucosidase